MDSILSEQSLAYNTFYERPGPINNQPLLDSNNRLIGNLVKHFDFEVVTFEVWKHLSSWYHYDQKICRRFVKDNHDLKLDLYPEEIQTMRFNTQ